MKMKSTTTNRNKKCNSATIFYSLRTYGINHIAEKAREGLQRERRINSVLDSNKGKYVNSGRKKKKKIILKQRPEILSLSSTLENSFIDTNLIHNFFT